MTAEHAPRAREGSSVSQHDVANRGVSASEAVAASSPPQVLKQLHRHYGNQAVQRLLAPSRTAPERPPSATSRAPMVIVQREVSTYWDKTHNVYQLDGRPNFTNALKKQVYEDADDNGETYIVNFSEDRGLSFKFPSVHRRHKLAWSLWREAVNAILRKGDEDDLQSFMQQCLVSSQFQTWSAKEFKRAYDEGRYLVDMAKDFFNDARNIWLGPGDENMGKGGGLDKQIWAYINNPNKKTKKTLVESAWDPRNKVGFGFDLPDPMTGTSPGWTYTSAPPSPHSQQMGYTVEEAMGYLKKFGQY